ncbi:hypothetical protein BH11ARM2_BH11ARM2_18190 [soil metagenome]
MSRLLGLVAVFAFLLLLGCGGGGGGGSTTDTGTTNGTAQTTFTGQVFDVQSGIPITPAATVTISGQSATTDVDTGDFSVTAAQTASKIDVSTTAYGAWSFPLPGTTASTFDTGVLYVGPERVTVKGTVRDSVTDSPIPGVSVTFGGRSATSGTDGSFSITGVAYSSTNTSGFFGIIGEASATGFITQSFDAANVDPVGGVISVGDVRLISSGDSTPPDGPYDLTGKVTRNGQTGTLLVELLQGGTVIRTAPTRTDDRYYFWIEPGVYQVRATVGASTVSSNVTVTATNQIVTKNLALP